MTKKIIFWRWLGIRTVLIQSHNMDVFSVFYGIKKYHHLHKYYKNYLGIINILLSWHVSQLVIYIKLNYGTYLMKKMTSFSHSYSTYTMIKIYFAQLTYFFITWTVIKHFLIPLMGFDKVLQVLKYYFKRVLRTLENHIICFCIFAAVVVWDHICNTTTVVLLICIRSYMIFK